MQTRPIWLCVVAAAALFCGLPAVAQSTSTAPTEASLVGTWLVTVDGETNTRTFIISNATPAASGALPDAKYGLSGGNLPPVNAKLARSGEVRQLHITTQASSIIAANEQPDGSFKGTFTTKSGAVKAVLISRVADGSLPPAAAPKDLAAVVPLVAGIPEECVALHGNWAGTWSQGRYGELFLRVVEASNANGNCILRFSYSESSTPVPARLTAEAKSGSLSFLCNRSTGGTCVFKPSGGDLWASYSDSSGGRNTAVFRRIKQ